MRVYNLGRWAYKKNINFLVKACEKWIRIFYGMSLKISENLGDNINSGYGGLGVVIHEDSVIGDNTTIAQNVTIGGKKGAKRPPRIGKNVYIGAGAVILGDISIGDNCIIGANSVVTKTFDSNCIICGVPAKIIKKNKVL
ncbi:serine O-acetyltransferase [Photobacterium damselae]|uniref:serine O-acetyltransferase n=1 Tax=Photobacterium damselae TaxID=38293 RepID=UPI0040690D1E